MLNPKYDSFKIAKDSKNSNSEKVFNRNSNALSKNLEIDKKASIAQSKRKVKSKRKKKKSKRNKNKKVSKRKPIKPNVKTSSNTARIEYNNGYPVLEGMSISGHKMKKGSFKKRFNGENHGFYF